MYRISLCFVILASAWTMSLAANCRSSVPAYDCEGTMGPCMAAFTGCYHSAAHASILPRDSLVNLRDLIDWQKWQRNGHARSMILDCAQLAVEKNKKYVGIEFFGECYFGDSPDLSQPQATTEEDCSKFCQYDVGGPDAMVLYRVITPGQV